MKTTIILFLLSITPAFSQVNCDEQNQNFSGKCESYNRFTGIRSSYSYKKGTLHGKFEESFENGQQRSLGSYKVGLLNGKFSAFHKTGEKLTEGKFREGTGSFTLFHTNGINKVKGQFEEGRAVGAWSYFNSNGDLSRESDVETSRMGMYAFLVGDELVQNEVVFENFFDSFDGEGFSFSFGNDLDSTMAGVEEQMKESMNRFEAQMEQMMQNFTDTSFMRSFQFDSTFSSKGFGNFDEFFDFKSFGDSSFFKSFHFDTIIGEMPQRSNPFFSSPDRDLVDFPDVEPSYIGGEDAMRAFIQREMRILDEKKETSKNGTVFIEVIVEKDGVISDSRVALGVDHVRDAEALRIISIMLSWEPASDKGQFVRSRCVIPVEFGLF